MPRSLLLESARLRVAQWMAGRHGREAGEVLLDRRRVYILPTVPGVVFGFALFVMLVGSINYGLQLGYLLTFLVASMAVTGMYHTHRNLARILVGGHRVEPVFAGDVMAFELRVTNPGPVARHALNFAFLLPARRSLGLRARREFPTSGSTVDLPAASTVSVTVSLTTRRRGRRACPRIRVSTRFPFGLWRAWSYVTPTLSAVVYPAPEPDAPPLPAAAEGTGDGSTPAPGGEEFGGIRPYQPGDPLKTVAWRLAARSDELSVKLFDAPAGGEVVLDLHRLPAALGLEERLSRLCRWILDAESAQVRYGLRLSGRGGVEIAPAQGYEHRERCLTALAEFGG